jgi:hypothetical protein
MIDMIDIDKQESKDNNNNDIQETTERNNDSDFGDGTT